MTQHTGVDPEWLVAYVASKTEQLSAEFAAAETGSATGIVRNFVLTVMNDINVHLGHDKEIPGDGQMILSAREAVILLLHLETGEPQDVAVGAILTPASNCNITKERVRQIRSKLMSRLRIRIGRGPHGQEVREFFKV